LSPATRCGDIGGGTRGADGVNVGAGGRLESRCVEVAEILLKLAELAGVGGWSGRRRTERKLGSLLLQLAFEDLALQGCVALVVKEGLDAEAISTSRRR